MREEIDKYFQGEYSNEEKCAFFDKIESDKSLKSEFIDIQNTVSLSKLYSQKKDGDLAIRMMNDLDKKIKQKRTRRIVLNIAKYAAVVVFFIINGWLIMNKTELQEDEISYTTIEVPKGQRISMTLTDGTEVWLSPRSVLRIPDKFNKKERVIELDGEGYFAVAKNVKKPFIVTTGQHKIKVLGTRFNVFSYSKSIRFETDLLHGKIEVFNINNPEKAILLNPGERVMMVDNKLVKSKSFFNNEDYLKNGIFNFNNKPFKEILEYLTLWYDIKFEIKDSAKKELLISGRFRQSDEVKNILKGLQGVHTFKYKEIDEQYIEIY